MHSVKGNGQNSVKIQHYYLSVGTEHQLAESEICEERESVTDHICFDILVSIRCSAACIPPIISTRERVYRSEQV